jgi:hypothetical protein
MQYKRWQGSCQWESSFIQWEKADTEALAAADEAFAVSKNTSLNGYFERVY